MEKTTQMLITDLAFANREGEVWLYPSLKVSKLQERHLVLKASQTWQASASAPGKQLPLKCVGLAFERSLRARVAPGVYAHGDSMISDISYHKKEEMLQNTPAGSVGSAETGLSQEDLMQASSSQRLWCPMGSPVLPPLTAGAHLGGQTTAFLNICRGHALSIKEEVTREWLKFILESINLAEDRWRKKDIKGTFYNGDRNLQIMGLNLHAEDQRRCHEHSQQQSCPFPPVTKPKFSAEVYLIFLTIVSYIGRSFVPSLSDYQHCLIDYSMQLSFC
ncbi:hypothetical protein Q9966_005441 [Columba livia]|nr:hypothetical protein Q9966_005441 [Columba livia]